MQMRTLSAFTRVRLCGLSSQLTVRDIPPVRSHSKLLAASFHTSLSPASKHIVNIQDEKDFDTRVLKNEVPVIVDFFANWCGPCKLLIPRLESLVAGKGGKVILAKIDIDELSDLAMNYGVEAVPTVIGMKDGKVIDKFVGLKDDADLETFVQKLIS
jgi:thioredoxin 1